MLRGVIQAAALLLVALTSAGCGNADADYDRGYDDGSVVGYNTTCHDFSGNLIHGDWENEDYSRGYADGMQDGIEECRREQESNRESRY